MDSYFGRTVLVTGASSGIGEAMARQLALRKARLVLTARSEDKLHALADEFRRLGADAAVYAHDLGQPGAARALWDRLDEDHRPDVLINNAGFGGIGRFVTNAPEEIEGMVTLNATNLAVLTRLALPEMLRRGFGGVLNVASTAAFVPAPYFAVYGASKAFVKSFSEALHVECEGTGVSVSCLCPGPTRTGFGERADMKASFFRKGESAERVAETGLDALLRGERVAVSGTPNKVMTAASRLAPQALNLAVAGRLMRAAADED
jgi:short-subunit dehydrogenase